MSHVNVQDICEFFQCYSDFIWLYLCVSIECQPIDWFLMSYTVYVIDLIYANMMLSYMNVLVTTVVPTWDFAWKLTSSDH